MFWKMFCGFKYCHFVSLISWVMIILPRFLLHALEVMVSRTSKLAAAYSGVCHGLGKYCSGGGVSTPDFNRLFNWLKFWNFVTVCLYSLFRNWKLKLQTSGKTELSFVILPEFSILMYLRYGDSAIFRSLGLNQKWKTRLNMTTQ